MNTESICNPEQNCDAGDWAKGIAVLGGIGAGFGALIGSVIKTDRWETVPPERIRVSFTPLGNDGFAVQASVKVP